LVKKHEDKITVRIIKEDAVTSSKNSGGLEDHIEIEVLSEMWGGERASDAVVTDLAALTEHQISR